MDKNTTKQVNPAPRLPARERLLAAAEALFYDEGFAAVGIDRVIDKAGVAKASLYDCFGSKDELIRAYLMARHDGRQARVARALEGIEEPRARLLAMFDVMAEHAAEANYKGCAFVRAGANAHAGSSAKEVCDMSRAWLKQTFAELATNCGVTDGDAFSRQMMMLYDGAAVSAQMDGNLKAIAAAKAAAAALLDVQIAPPARPAAKAAPEGGRRRKAVAE